MHTLMLNESAILEVHFSHFLKLARKALSTNLSLKNFFFFFMQILFKIYFAKEMILKHQQISHNISFIFVYFSELFLKIGKQVFPRKKNFYLC